MEGFLKVCEYRSLRASQTRRFGPSGLKSQDLSSNLSTSQHMSQALLVLLDGSKHQSLVRSAWMACLHPQMVLRRLQQY